MPEIDPASWVLEHLPVGGDELRKRLIPQKTTMQRSIEARPGDILYIGSIELEH